MFSKLKSNDIVCPHLGSRAETILHSSLNALTKLQYAWPMAIKWQQALHKVAASQSETHFPSRRAKTPREHPANSPVSRGPYLSLICLSTEFLLIFIRVARIAKT